MTISTVEKSGMIWRCENNDGCGTRIASLAFVRDQQCMVFLAIRRRVLSVSIGGGKKCLRYLRLHQARMVRSQATLGARLGVWRLSNLFGYRGTSDRLPAVQESEAREAGLAGGQSVLQQAVCLLCGATLSGHDDQRRGSRNPFGLEDGQGVGQAVHA